MTWKPNIKDVVLFTSLCQRQCHKCCDIWYARHEWRKCRKCCPRTRNFVICRSNLSCMVTNNKYVQALSCAAGFNHKSHALSRYFSLTTKNERQSMQLSYYLFNFMNITHMQIIIGLESRSGGTRRVERGDDSSYLAVTTCSWIKKTKCLISISMY
jgi:recombinational DNA repair protein RecR